MPVHPTALIHPSLVLPPDLEVGPYAVVDQDVVLAAGVRIGPFCHLYPGTRLEPGVKVGDGSVLGSRPQDMKFAGEQTWVHIGQGTELREYVTVNRGTQAGGTTRIGRDCLVMAYTHVAHDCAIGNQVILANGIQMGGHVTIGSCTVVSGMTGIHQFVHIGPGSFVGGVLRVDKDIPPFSKAMGDPLAWAGVNEIGLRKLGFGEGQRKRMKDFYRRLWAGGRTTLPELAETTPETEGEDARLLGLVRGFFLGERRRGIVTVRRGGRAHPR